MTIEEQRSSERGRVHYSVAYKILPKKLFLEGPDFIAKLKAENATAYLERLWAVTCADYMISFIPPTGLKTEVVEFQGTELILITFPEPERVPQSHFAAILKQQETYRYFTLEVYYNFADFSQVLGEITAKGMHKSYREVAAATHEEFLKAIEEKLEEENRSKK